VEQVGLTAEKEIAERVGLHYRSFPIPDHQTPPLDAGTMDFLDARRSDLSQGKGVVFHCSSGRGRTTLMAASLLVMEGMDPDKAIQHVRGRRLVPVPDNKEQTEWVRQLSANLGRPVEGKEAASAAKGYVKIAVAAGAAALALFGVWQWRRRAR
jgi:protein-tyrosine phosphatase